MNNAMTEFLKAQAKVNSPGFNELSYSSQQRAWRKYFAAEDALKTASKGGF